jgi:ATP-dependent Clp protease ATP-binding subunit ClpA
MEKIIMTILVPRIEQRFAGRKASLLLSEAALQYILGNCDPSYGVRNLAQLLDNEITKPLTEAFIERRFADGSRIEVKLREGRIALERA